MSADPMASSSPGNVAGKGETCVVPGAVLPNGRGNPMTNADRFDAVMRSATVIRTLHANLVAARRKLADG